MLVNTFDKQKKKAKTKRKAVPESVMKIVRERSKGICECCHGTKCNGVATDPHHIKEKSQCGLDIPINILHVSRACHNHSNTEFINNANYILRSRIEGLFLSSTCLYPVVTIAKYIELPQKEIERQMSKGFLNVENVSPTWGRASSKEDIMRWLGVA